MLRHISGLVEDGGDILSAVSGSRAQSHDLVLNGQGVHVINHNVVRNGEQRGLAVQGRVLVEDHVTQLGRKDGRAAGVGGQLGQVGNLGAEGLVGEAGYWNGGLAVDFQGREHLQIALVHFDNVIEPAHAITANGFDCDSSEDCEIGGAKQIGSMPPISRSVR